MQNDRRLIGMKKLEDKNLVNIPIKIQLIIYLFNYIYFIAQKPVTLYVNISNKIVL